MRIAIFFCVTAILVYIFGAVFNGIKIGIPTVVSFWPHPREVLFGESRLRLDLPNEKTYLLEPLGIEQLVLVPFNKTLASKSAEKFVDEILVKTSC